METPGPHVQTPLSVASMEGDAELVDFLLAVGASIDGDSAAGMTPLMHAARSGHYQTVATLLARGINCHPLSAEGWTSLHYAVYGLGGADLTDLFVGHVDVDIPTDIDWETPLLIHVKLYRNSLHWWDKYKALLCGDANVNKQDSQGYSPLLIAIEDDRVELARDLIYKQSAVVHRNYSRFPDMSAEMSKLVNREARSTGQQRSAISQAATVRQLA